MPGAAGAAQAWLADHLGVSPSGGEPGQSGADAPGSETDPRQPGADGPRGQAGDSEPAAGQPGAGQPGQASQGADGQPGAGSTAGAPAGLATGWPGDTSPGLGSGTRAASGSPFWPDPDELFSRPDRRAARHYAAGSGEGGWLTGKAAEAYSCDAKIASMVCGHLNRNHLATAVAAFLAGDLANLAVSTAPMPVPGPRCECDEHPARRRAPIPGARPATSLPGGAALTPGGLDRLQDTLLRYAVSLLSGPAGLASYLRTQLTGGFFPAPSLPLDLGEPTEQVPPHLRRAVIKRDRHCSFPGCAQPAVRCHVHHVIPRSQGGPTRLDNLTLLCHFHHLIAIHRWGWTLTLHADGSTTARSPDGIRTLHSHGPPPGQDTLWAGQSRPGSPASAA